MSGNCSGITGAAGKEVEIKYSANNVVLQRSVGKFDIHAIRIQQEHAVSARCTVFEIDGVVPIKIGAIRSTKRIARPQCESGVGGGQVERVGVLPEAVNVSICRQSGLDTKVLRLEDDGMGCRGKENLGSGCTIYREREWRRSVVELDRGRTL